MTHTFLYVEDDAFSREIMRTIFKVLGHQTLTVFEDSKDFETRVQSLTSAPDVIFLDIHMKPIDGFEMLHILRGLPALADKPVIALTASVMNDEIERLQQSGFDGAIGKPLDYDTFPEQLQLIIDGESVWYVA
jgi:CheY-like chemotaxis protein